MIIVGVCNPYKLKRVNEDRQSEVVEAHPDKQSQLSHQVLPIPSRLLLSLWDFGSLNSKIEKSYIKSILGELKFGNNILDKISEIINVCQEFIRKDVEKNPSSVSLRDIQRVKEIIQFFFMVIWYRKQYSDLSSKFDHFCLEKECVYNKKYFDIWLRSVIVALYLCYIYRIFNCGK